jgi:hypothetical protein
MVNIAIGKNEIIITLDTREQFFALKRRISIPLTNIASVSTERAKPSWLSIKVGTHVPKGFMAGTFWTRRGKTFYYVRDFFRCITLHLKNHVYAKVVVEVDDKEAIAKKLREVIK